MYVSKKDIEVINECDALLSCILQGSDSTDENYRIQENNLTALRKLKSKMLKQQKRQKL